MNSFSKVAVLISWLLLSLLPSNGSAAPDSAEWRAKMQGLFSSLQNLLAVTVDEKKFNDPASASIIEENAKKLAQSAHAMTAITASSPDLDPSVRMLSGILEDQTSQALQAYQLGSREYARTLFHSTSAQCVACHSRNDSGVRLEWDLNSGPAASLPPHQKAQLLAAGRSYSPAIDLLSESLASPALAKERPFEWNQALRTALVLAVRTEKNPSRAIAVLQKAMKTEGVPQFVKWDSRNWLRSLQAWDQELKNGSRDLKTEESSHREALRLISLAQKTQRFPMDRAGDVLYLRASGVLHDQLRRFPSGPKSAEAFFLLGICYEILRDFDLWTLGDTYFEACIHRQPHSNLAESCYRKLEESTLAGYTGSSGTQVPLDVEKKLTRLRTEAQAMGQVPEKKKRF